LHISICPQIGYIEKSKKKAKVRQVPSGAIFHSICTFQSIHMKINIVTVTFNDFDNLKYTLSSIRKYKKKYHCYYVIDGESSDKTAELIETNKDIIDDVIIESDKGIYDAMNKVARFNFAKDDFILWLNAGDELINWDNIDHTLFNNYGCIFFSVYTKINRNDNPKICIPQIILPYNAKNYFPRSIFMHQGFVIRSHIFDVYKYDTEIGLQAENLLMSKCIQNENYTVCELPVSIFLLDGLSNRNTKDVFFSYLRVARKLGFKNYLLMYYHIHFIIRSLVKMLIPYRLIVSYRKIRRNLQ